MSKRNRIKRDYFFNIFYKQKEGDKEVEKTDILRLLTIVVSKRGYKPRKKDEVDETLRVELRDLYQLSILLNDLIRDVSYNIFKNGYITLYMNDKGLLDIRRDDEYIFTSLLHLETDLDIKVVEEFLDNCRESIVESMAVNIPPILTENVLIYKGSPDDNLLPLGQSPRSLGINFTGCSYL